MSLQDEILRETKREFLRDSYINRECRLVSFVSSSKGRGRTRAVPLQVELLRYAETCYLLQDDWFPGLDALAREITGSDDTKEFLNQLRNLTRMI